MPFTTHFMVSFKTFSCWRLEVNNVADWRRGESKPISSTKINLPSHVLFGRYAQTWTSMDIHRFSQTSPKIFFHHCITVNSLYSRYLVSYRCGITNLPTPRVRIDASHTYVYEIVTASIIHIYCKILSIWRLPCNLTLIRVYSCHIHQLSDLMVSEHSADSL